MGIFNKSIPKYTGNLYNEIIVEPTVEEPVTFVDDIYDPLFNKAVRKRLMSTYNNPIGATLGGYYELINSALMGNKKQGGTMLPGIGVLSSFGRSMDKSGDIILGTLTEGVKGLTGQGIESPLYNIFTDDQDYSGQRILAAATNSMAKLAGAPEVTEADFGGVWTLPSLGIDLATDPSILGGNLSRIAKGQGAVAEAGKLLTAYDDVMAKAAIDVTAPGFRHAASKFKNIYSNAIGHSSAAPIEDVQFNISEPDVKAALEVLQDSKASLTLKDKAYTILKDAKGKVRNAFSKVSLSEQEQTALNTILDDNTTADVANESLKTLFGEPGSLKRTVSDMADEVSKVKRSASKSTDITPTEALKNGLNVDAKIVNETIPEAVKAETKAKVGAQITSSPPVETVKPKHVETKKDISDAVTKEADDFSEKVVSSFKNLTDDEIADNAFEVFDLTESAALKVIHELDKDELWTHTVKPSTQVSRAFKNRYSLHKYLSDMAGETIMKPIERSKASLSTQEAKSVLEDVRKFKKKYVDNELAVRNVIDYRDRLVGDVLKGDDIVNEILFAKKLEYVSDDIAKTDEIRNAFNKTVDDLNKALGADIYAVYETKYGKNTYLALSYSGKPQYVNKANWKALNKLKLDDIVFTKPGDFTGFPMSVLDEESFKEASKLIDSIGELVQNQAKFLGFDIDPSTYVKHAMEFDPSTAELWSNLQESANLPIGKTGENILEAYSNSILRTGRFNDKYGAFFVKPNVRSLRGRALQYDLVGKNMFTADLTNIAKSALSGGMFAGANFQSVWGVFKSGTFNIPKFVHSDDELVNVLKLGDDTVGNQNNLQLAAPKYNSSGRIIGFTRYDKFNPDERLKALNNPEAVIIDNAILSVYDSVLRHQNRLSNKAFTFINKHLTLPFKLGCLLNPGFVFGNLGDAVLKQASTMAEKYGTSVTEEIAKIYEAHRAVTNLNNDFSNVFDIYIKQLKDAGAAPSPDDIPELLTKSPTATAKFVSYLNSGVRDTAGNVVIPALTAEQYSTAKLYMFLKNVQSGSFVDMEIKEMSKQLQDELNSQFYKPSFIERLTTNKSSYKFRDPSTWDVWHNNPVGRGVLDVSEGIETYMREAMIYNDLMHSGLDVDAMRKLINAPIGSKEHTNLRMGIVNAVNTMHNANFDYANITDAMDFASTYIPFPTFYLKNVAYWLNMFIEHPQYVDTALAINEGLWANEDTSSDEFKAGAKARGAIPLSAIHESKDGQKLSNFFKGIYKPSPLQSMFGAFNAMNNPLESLSQRTHPLIQGAQATLGKVLPFTDLTTDPENIRYRPYNTNQYQPNIDVSEEEFNPLAYTAHKMNPFDRTLSTGLRTPGKVKRGEAQLSDFLPSVFQPDFSKKSSKK